MKSPKLTFLTVLVLTGITVFGQKEQDSRFNRTTLIDFGITQIIHFYECVQHVNSCEIYDPEGMLYLFTDDARIWVSTLSTHRIIDLYPERYLSHLNHLRCEPGARYRSFLFQYEIEYSKITCVVYGGRCLLSIPVVQRFQGMGRTQSNDYQDITIKQVDFLCYYDRGILAGKISAIRVESTNQLL
jgi:hypothetical protein